jgi:hypothetical protein
LETKVTGSGQVDNSSKEAKVHHGTVVLVEEKQKEEKEQLNEVLKRKVY